MPEAALWSFGSIEGSGLGIRPGYADFDARKRFGLFLHLRSGRRSRVPQRGAEGEIIPGECRFLAAPAPRITRGACMVSSEGACSSYF